MKTKLMILLGAAGLIACLDDRLATVMAQGTAFTYSGSFDDGANPANGTYNLLFNLYTSPTGGTAVGSVTNLGASVVNGYFSVMLDFGPVFNGSNYWMELDECTNGTFQYIIQTPRALVTSVPAAVYATTSALAGYSTTAGSATSAITATSAGYAATAGTAALAGSVAAANLAGTLSYNQLPASLVTNGQAAVNLGGTFNGLYGGNGSGLTNLNGSANIFSNCYGGSFTLGNGNWFTNTGNGGFTNSVAYVGFNQSPFQNGQSAFDIIPAAVGDDWIDICDTNVRTNNTRSGQWLHLMKNYNSYCSVSAIGSLNGVPVFQNLILQDPVYGGAGLVGIGTDNLAQNGANSELTVEQDGNAFNEVINVVNHNNGSSAAAGISIVCGTNSIGGGLYLGAMSTTLTPIGAAFGPAGTIIKASIGAASLNLCTTSNTSPVNIFAGGYAAGNLDLVASNNSVRIPVPLTAMNGANQFSGTFTGNGAGLTNLAVPVYSGSIADGQLSANIPRLNQANAFSNPNNNFTGTFTGNACGISNVSASVLVGTLADNLLSTNVPLLNQADTFSNPSNVFAGTFSGNGAGLTNLSVPVYSGSIADSQLSANIPRLSQANTFANASNLFVGAFTGNGAGLTNLSVPVYSGGITDSQLSANIPRLNQANSFGNPGNVFAGTFAGSGAGLTNLPVTGLSGTLADSQLSTNVPLMNQADTFSNPSNVFVGSFAGNGSGVTSLGAANLVGNVPLSALGNALTNWSSNIVVTNIGTGNSVVLNNGQVLINGFPAMTNSIHTTGTPKIVPNVGGEYARIINSSGDQYMTVVIWFTNTPSAAPGTKIFTINYANPYTYPPCVGYSAGLSSDGTFDGGMRPTLFSWGVGPTNASLYISSASAGAVPVTGKFYTNYITFTGQ